MQIIMGLVSQIIVSLQTKIASHLLKTVLSLLSIPRMNSNIWENHLSVDNSHSIKPTEKHRIIAHQRSNPSQSSQERLELQLMKKKNAVR